MSLCHSTSTGTQTDILRWGTDCIHRCHIAGAPLEVVFSVPVYWDDSGARHSLSTCRGVCWLICSRQAHLWRDCAREYGMLFQETQEVGAKEYVRQPSQSILGLACAEYLTKKIRFLSFLNCFIVLPPIHPLVSPLASPSIRWERSLILCCSPTLHQQKRIYKANYQQQKRKRG